MLIQTTLRIPDDVKKGAEDAAAAEDRSFSNYVSEAVAEKLSRERVITPLAPANVFTVTVTFESEPDEAHGVTASVHVAAAGSGAANVSTTLAAVFPPA